MAKQCQLLSDLTNGPNWDYIQVRVSRMWDSISKSANEVYSKNLQLLDIQGNQKHALVPKCLLEKISNTFEEQCVYEIGRFNVYPSQPSYRAIDEDLMIILRRDTEIKRLSTTISDFPKYKFGFVQDDMLAQRIDKVSHLTDIAGVLTGISDVVQLTTRTGCQTAKRELTLSAIGGKIISVTLWADKTTLIDLSTANTENQPTTLIFTSMIVKLYRGEFTFSSTNATKMYANIDLTDLTDLISSPSPSGVSTVSTINTQVTSENIQTVRTTIASMLTYIRNNDCLEKKYIVHVTLLKINTSGGWSYLSCPLCRKTLKREESCFVCPTCNTNVANPVNRYRLSTEVIDHTASATAIAFDKEAECLVKHTVDDMIELSNLEHGVEMVHKLFNRLIGAEAQLEFRPTNYDIINQGKTMTISRISNIHHPYEPIDQMPTKLNKTTLSSSILTAESITAKETSSERKGKENVFNDDNVDEIKESTQPSSKKNKI